MPDPKSEPTWMNPFWFVPMDGTPASQLTLAQWGVYDEGTRTRPQAKDLLTGKIIATLTTLTPLHVSGRIEAPPVGAMRQRYFYRRIHPSDPAGKSRPVVEGASLRGMLRSYVEALTNGVASSYITGYEHSSKQAQSGPYAKDKNRRHIGFWVGREPAGKTSSKERFAAYREQFPTPGGNRYRFGDREGVKRCDEPAHMMMPESIGDRVANDLAPKGGRALHVDATTLMFGLVGLEGEKSGRKDAKAYNPAQPVPVPAIAGRVRFTDAWFQESDLQQDLTSLDLDGKAILGGGKPSKSSWWYFKPDVIRQRQVSAGSNTFQLAEFVGGQLRGRKFYFHQEPGRCVQWYLDHWQHQNIRTVSTECIRSGARSETFSIHFEDLPRSLVQLLLVALSPSCGVRHKLGALRPFGFGSVEIQVEDVLVERTGPDGLDLTSVPPLQRDEHLLKLARPAEETDGSRAESNESEQDRREHSLVDPKGGYLVDELAWSYVRLIGYCPRDDKRRAAPHRLFVYPPFRSPQKGAPPMQPLERGFAFPVQTQDIERTGVKLPVVSAQVQERVLGGLWKATKRAIDLDYYQLHADNFAAVNEEALPKTTEPATGE
jgi:hypothetical protein